MSQSTRRGSTQAPEAGPSTSRRLSRAPVDGGDSQQDDEDGERRHTILVKRKLLRQQEREEEDANHIDFGELEEPLPEPEINEEFRNQPLKKEEAVLRLNNLIKEWKEVDRRVTGSLELLANSAGDLQEALANGDDDPAANEELKLADRDFRRLLDKLYEVDLRRGKLEDLRLRISEGRLKPKALDEMEESIQEELTRYNALTSRKKYLNNEKYSTFRTLLWEALGNNQGVPPLKTFIDREDGDSESDDEDIEVQGAAQNFKDPITFGWLEKPVRSNACKHVYSRASITEHIRQSGGRAKQAPCPVAGCNKIVALDSLQDDPQLERRVQQHVRRVREQEERAQGNYQAIGDDDDSDEDDLNVRRPRKREE